MTYHHDHDQWCVNEYRLELFHQEGFEALELFVREKK
jgi:hypothetical protein